MPYPDSWGLKYSEVQGLAWLAYKANGTSTGRYSFPNSGSVWTVDRIIESGGFRAVLVRGSTTVLSFSGTDDLTDWIDNVQQGFTGISLQYAQALALALSTPAQVYVGHSLGGGLASYCGIYTRKPTATINPAPLNINLISGAAMIANGGWVVNYVVPGEALMILDFVMLNMRKVGRNIRVGTTAGRNPIDRHLIPNLEDFVTPVKI